MSLSTIDQSTGNATVISGNVNDKVGNLAALTTTDKSSAVGAINEVKSGLTSVTEQANKTVYQNTDRLVCFSSVEGAIIIMCHNPTLGKSIGISIGLDGTIARYEEADV